MKTQDLQWNDLSLILAICRSGSLSGAARILGVTHSTVFRRIQGIEEKLGVRLFERMSSGYVMTEAGEAAYQVCERIEAEVQGLSRQLVGRDLRLRGSLRITAPDALTQHVLMRHLAGFQRRYPDIQLELSTTNTALNLTQREADVAVRATRVPPELAIGRRLCGLATTFYASERYLEALPEHIGEGEYEHLHWLMPHKSLEPLPANRWLQARCPRAHVVMHCDTLPALEAAASQGLGLAPLPCFMADPKPLLKRYLPPPPELDSELWLLSHPDLRRTARVRAFVEYLVESMQPEIGAIEGDVDAG